MEYKELLESQIKILKDTQLRNLNNGVLINELSKSIIQYGAYLKSEKEKK